MIEKYNNISLWKKAMIKLKSFVSIPRLELVVAVLSLRDEFDSDVFVMLYGLIIRFYSVT